MQPKYAKLSPNLKTKILRKSIQFQNASIILKTVNLISITQIYILNHLGLFFFGVVLSKTTQLCCWRLPSPYHSRYLSLHSPTHGLGQFTNSCLSIPGRLPACDRPMKQHFAVYSSNSVLKYFELFCPVMHYR